MLAVSYFWNLAGSSYEEAQWLAQLLPHRHTLVPDLRLAILLTFYRAAFALEEFQPIDRWTHEVMQLIETCTDNLLRAFAWSLIAGTISDVAQATAATERAIALARAASEAPGLGTEFGAIADRDFVLAAYLCGYATSLVEQGEIDRASPIAAESLELARARGDRWGIGDGLGMLGRLALLQGDLVEAQRLFHEAVSIAKSLNNPSMQCAWQPFLGLVTLYGGDAAEARQLLNESLHLALDLKNTFFLAQICTYLAETALWTGEVEQAAHWLAQSLVYQAAPRRITRDEIDLLLVAARLATAQGDYRRAAMLFGVSEQAHSHIHYVYAGPVHAQADAALKSVRAALSPALFAEAFSAGEQLTLEAALSTLLAPVQLATMSTQDFQLLA
jgi:ATP/maltotriose-dependent transcriptional regulator MalT